mmetsp:Transcript_23946/g.35150  ORF Transcript_23946/g.35150 Transcript_23946/m.35150 type:complete len:510 (-) Transcript_23946:110-1639(-)
MSQRTQRTPQAAGCSFSYTDIPRLFASFSVYGCSLGYGACLAIVGAAIPEMSRSIVVPVEELGQLFVSKGLGYFTGVVVSSVLMERFDIKIPRHVVVALFVIIFSAPAALVMAVSSSLIEVNLCAYSMGIGFAGLDSFAIVGLSEMWELRVQPYLQIKSACVSVGGILGPILVSSYGYKPAFTLASVLCCSCLLGLLAEHAFIFVQYRRDMNTGIPAVMRTSSGLSVGETQDYFSEELKAVEQIATRLSEGSLDVLVRPPEVRKSLSFATPPVLEVAKELRVLSPPSWFISPLVLLYCLLYGLYYAYGGWIPTYVLASGISTSSSEAAAAASVYYMSLFVGTLTSVLLSVFLPTTVMLRGQILCMVSGAATLLLLPDFTLFSLAVATSLVGYGISSTFCLVMVLSNDYGFTMNSFTTSILLLAGTAGECLLPYCIGTLLAVTGPRAFPLSVACMVLLTLVFYTCAHCVGAHYQAVTENERDNGMYSSIPLSEGSSLIMSASQQHYNATL